MKKRGGNKDLQGIYRKKSEGRCKRGSGDGRKKTLVSKRDEDEEPVSPNQSPRLNGVHSGHTG